MVTYSKSKVLTAIKKRMMTKMAIVAKRKSAKRTRNTRKRMGKRMGERKKVMKKGEF